MRLSIARFEPTSLIDHAGIPGAALCAALMLSSPALAAPPANVDPSLAPWFQSLRQPGTGASCCSIADCRMTESRATRSGYEALVGKKWLPVPPDRVLQHTTNPTGRAIVCCLPGEGILCFVRAAES